jgi:hypothetical protein
MASNSAEYQAAYRSRNPEYQQRQKKLEKARHEAARVLAARHPEEYRAILNHIKRREGL